MLFKYYIILKSLSVNFFQACDIALREVLIKHCKHLNVEKDLDLINLI